MNKICCTSDNKNSSRNVAKEAVDMDTFNCLVEDKIRELVDGSKNADQSSSVAQNDQMLLVNVLDESSGAR